jgi:hypothetical protein
MKPLSKDISKFVAWRVKLNLPLNEVKKLLNSSEEFIEIQLISKKYLQTIDETLVKFI